MSRPLIVTAVQSSWSSCGVLWDSFPESPVSPRNVNFTNSFKSEFTPENRRQPSDLVSDLSNARLAF